MTTLDALGAGLTEAETVMLNRQDYLIRNTLKESRCLLSQKVLQIDTVKPGLTKIARKEYLSSLVDDLNN
jgi:hypothetical protein